MSLGIGPHDFDCSCDRCETRRLEIKYSIVQTNRNPKGKGTWEKVVESGIAGFKAAFARAEELNAAERAKHPEKTTWTTDLFIVQREK